MLMEGAVTLFETSSWMIELNTGDVTHEESLYQPQPAGNCMNWVLGHLVKTRGEIVTLLGSAPVLPRGRYARYGMGSARLVDPRQALPFEEIQRAYKDLQDPIVNGIRNATDEQLDKTVDNSPTGDPDQSVGTLLVLLAFHEAYHTGQTGLLRAMLGKERRFP